jgi:hypothetical protein
MRVDNGRDLATDGASNLTSTQFSRLHHSGRHHRPRRPSTRSPDPTRPGALHRLVTLSFCSTGEPIEAIAASGETRA